MKTITLILILVTFSLQAQDFPDPYCDIDPEGTTVEELTRVSVGDSTFVNEDTSSILIDKTSNVVDVAPGETLALTVEGDTKGEFKNVISAFIDWNQNGVLDDQGEIYEIDTLYNSNGDDGKSVSLSIEVPDSAELGLTRLRITKTYTDEDSPAIVNPCAIEMNAFGQGAFPGFGQAIDLSLKIEELETPAFQKEELSIYPIPAKNNLTIDYKSKISAVKIYNFSGREVFSTTQKAAHFELDISALNSGLYIIKLINSNGSKNFKIVKQ